MGFRGGLRFKKIVWLILFKDDMNIYGIGIRMEYIDEMMIVFYN